MTGVELSIIILRIAIILIFTLSLIPILVFMERKISAYVQDRPGPNRTNIGGIRLAGIVQSVADVLKLVFKEDFKSSSIKRKFLFILAPVALLLSALLSVSIIPYAGIFELFGVVFEGVGVNTSISMLMFFGFSALSVYGLMIAGYASSNKYSLLSSLRAASSSISYELPLGLCIVSMALTYNSFDLYSYINFQGENFYIFGVIPIPQWGFIIQPFAFLIFLICAFAETNRLPFDTSEGESEIVAGYHLEYSSMSRAMYFPPDNIALVSMSALIVSVFLGGYNLPFINNLDLLNHYNYTLIALIILVPLGIILFLIWMNRTNKINYKSNLAFSKSALLNTQVDRRRENKILNSFFIITLILLEIGLAFAYIYRADGDLANLVILIVNFIIFAIKTILVIFFFMMVRWTLPRFRYDQVQKLSYKVLLPLSLLNVVITAIFIVVF